jgi:hypothetical protein
MRTGKKTNPHNTTHTDADMGGRYHWSSEMEIVVDAHTFFSHFSPEKKRKNTLPPTKTTK